MAAVKTLHTCLMDRHDVRKGSSKKFGNAQYWSQYSGSKHNVLVKVLLMKILSAMGLSREKVYLGNILNWRPRHKQTYGNRPPTREEMDFCLPYLKAQL